MSEESRVVDEVARVIRAATAQLDDVGDCARRSTLDGWAGHAARAYQARVVDQVRRTDAMSLLLREGAAAIEAYAASVADGEDPAATAAFLATLAGLHPSFWRGRVGEVDPGDRALDRCPRDGTPDHIQRWWRGLSDVERRAVIVVAPGLIGALDGLPASVRSLANRVALTRDLTAGHWRRTHSSLSPGQRRALRISEETDEALEDLAARGLAPQLQLYDPTAFEGDGKVAIGVGDLDEAEHLSILVPGFGHDGSDLTSLSERVGNLYEAADHASDESVAVVGWLGYDTPDNVMPWGSDLDALDVVSDAAADAGGQELDTFVDGLRATDEQPRHLSVIGHSYGSVAVGQAAHDHLLAVDELVVVGSPGLGRGVEGPDDLGLDRDHVWVGANSRDPVTHLGDQGWVNPGVVGVGLGNDPAEDAFEAQRFRAESTSRAGADRPELAIDDHSKYFDHGSESLSNIVYVITDQHDRVELARPVTDTWRSEPHDPEWDRTPQGRQTRP